MVYYSSHQRENSSSALSFTSSMASANGASFASSDDPTGNSSLLLSMMSILQSVYRCDSAAVVDGASKCGSVANQALYQGVEVILRTTTCNNYGTKAKDSYRESVASKPFFEYQCFCDDDDFILNEEYPYAPASQIINHILNVSNVSSGSGESRNESNPSLNASSLLVNDIDDDVRNNIDEASSLPVDDVRNKADVANNEAVTIRRSKWTAHTKSFYSKISFPAQRVVTTLNDVAPPSISSPRRPLLIETFESSISTEKSENKDKSNQSSMESSPSASLKVMPGWVPREIVSESREQ